MDENCVGDLFKTSTPRKPIILIVILLIAYTAVLTQKIDSGNSGEK